MSIISKVSSVITRFIFERNTKDLAQENIPLNSNEENEILEKEMIKTKEDERFFDGRVTDFVDEKLLLKYVEELFATQADKTEKTQQKRYKDDIVFWTKSSATRSKLVVLEASSGNIDNLASYVFNNHTKSRLVIVGLNKRLQKKLKADLVTLYEERKRSMKQSLPSAKYEETWKEKYNDIPNMTLEALMGPHAFIEDLNVGKANMLAKFPQFDANIEEIICFGETDTLSVDTAKLAQNIKNKPQVFSVTSSSSNQQEEDQWLGIAKKPEEFLKMIVEGQSSETLFGKRTIVGYENITIAKPLQPLLSGVGLQNIAERHGIPLADDFEQSDLDYFIKIMFHGSLYESNITPEGIALMISKGTSSLGAKKALTVAAALMRNIIDQPTSSAVELDFAIGAMVLDGGGDLLKENLSKKVGYKCFYDKAIQILTDKNLEKQDSEKDSVDTIREKALLYTINEYCAAEKRNERVQDYTLGNSGAKALRELGLKFMNKVAKANKIGIRFLKLAVPIFFLGVGATALGVATFFFPPLAVITLPLAITGGVLLGLSISSIIASMVFQVKANKFYTKITSMGFALANSKNIDAQKEIDKELASGIDRIKNDTILDIRNVPKLLKPELQSPIEQEKELIGIIEKVEGEATETSGKVKGKFSIPSIVNYTTNLFSSQAARDRASKNVEYSRNLLSWTQSATSRERLVIVEAQDDIGGRQKNVKEIAKIVFEASTLERVLVAGLTNDLKTEFTDALRLLWKAKYATSLAEKTIFRKYFNKITNVKNIDLDNPSIDTLIDRMGLEQLLGPHKSMEGLNTKFETLQDKFPQFDSGIEEILYFGNHIDLVKDASDLSRKIGRGVPFLTVKSSAINDADVGLWRCSALGSKSFLGELTKSRSSEELLGKNPEGFSNVKICNGFDTVLNLNSFKEERTRLNLSVSQDITQTDLDYFKKIFFDEALYAADTSPGAMDKAISKVTSILMVKAGVDVGNSLKWNILGRPKNIEEEVLYALAFLALDSGVDIIKEVTDKKNVYKDAFEKLYTSFKDEIGLSPDEATRTALIQTIGIYVKNERDNLVIAKMTTDGNKWRNWSIQNANEARRRTKKALIKLLPAAPIFLINVAATITGIVTAIFVPPVAWLIALTAGGCALFGTKLGIKWSAIDEIRTGNSINMQKSNFGSAQAGTVFSDIHKERKYQTEVACLKITKEAKAAKRTIPYLFKSYTAKSGLNSAENSDCKVPKAIQVKPHSELRVIQSSPDIAAASSSQYPCKNGLVQYSDAYEGSIESTDLSVFPLSDDEPHFETDKNKTAKEYSKRDDEPLSFLRALAQADAKKAGSDPIYRRENSINALGEVPKSRVRSGIS